VGGEVTLADDVPDDARTTAARLALAHVVTKEAVGPLIRPSSG